ncbi:AAA family ATPase [Psychromonas sp. SP041]|uniref:AAA family ATPase n=1 Tax=Psychromonas sp. SP041 TaxID=1365007 RepID=UPI0010C77272|nr:AAA family ATPase [Psychromonas sp. SP041]
MVERTLISLPSQLQLIERLQHLIYLSSSLTFVSGEAGSGKSTLTENLSNILPSDLQQVYISLVNEPTENALRQKIVAQLYNKALFNAEDKLLDTIFRLQQSEKKTKNKLIIIDNAQYLPAGFIIELCELFSEPSVAQDNTFNVLLLTDEKTTQDYITYLETHLVSRLQSTLNHLELSLPPLGVQEANELLLHNFQQVGYQAKLQHQDALNRQLTLCNGNPQKIIILAENLSQGLLETVPPSWIKTKLPAVLLMLMLVIIVSLLAAYLYPKFVPNSLQINASDNDLLVEDKITGLTSTESTKQESLASSWSTLDLGVENNQSMVGLSDNTEQRVVISDNQLIELTILSDTTNQPANNNTEQHQVPLLLQLPAVINDNVINKGDLLDSSSESELISTKQKVTKITDSDIKPTVESNDEEILNVVDELLINVSTSVVKKDKPLTSTEKEDSLLTPSYILRSKNPDNFTVQISGMASRPYLAAFQQKYKSNTENVFSYKTIRNNKPWFVVIYGEYSSVESANLAIKSLPEAFKGMPTWIKTWQAVHNDLRLNNE